MKKRLRKKLHLVEFTKLGFKLRFEMSEDLSDVERDLVLDEFIAEIERLGLQVGGGGIREWNFFVSLAERGSATEEHRATILAWLESHPRINRPDVGSLVDAWH